jgi:hypothetical protein
MKERVREITPVVDRTRGMLMHFRMLVQDQETRQLVDQTLRDFDKIDDLLDLIIDSED